MTDEVFEKIGAHMMELAYRASNLKDETNRPLKRWVMGDAGPA